MSGNTGFSGLGYGTIGYGDAPIQNRPDFNKRREISQTIKVNGVAVNEYNNDGLLLNSTEYPLAANIVLDFSGKTKTKTIMTSQVDINEYAEGAVLLDGLEEAIIGIVEEFGNGRRLLYSKSKILSILCERDLMTMGEAEEFYDYNIVGLHAGEQNAVFLDLDIKPIKKDEQWEYHLNENI
jgi:hypothetical protein